MESQPQNPEFRNNPKNFHPWSKYPEQSNSFKHDKILNKCNIKLFVQAFC